MPFDPKNLKYGPDGIPILRATEIAQIATEVLEKHCPAVLRKPAMTPVMEIIDGLRESTKLTSVITDLGTKGTAKILGKVSFSTKLLSLDTVLTTERKVQLRFTAGHEIGHWILHRWNFRNWTFPLSNAVQADLEDDEASLCRLEERSPQDWLEWQANVFAAELTMPRATFQDAVIETQLFLGITKNIGIVWISDADYSHRDFRQLGNRLSNIYDVSLTSIRVRLKTLKLLFNEEAAATRSASDVLSKQPRNR